MIVDTCRIKLDNIVSGMLQGSVFGPVVVLLNISQFLSVLENKLIGYTNDSTLMAVVPFLGV